MKNKPKAERDYAEALARLTPALAELSELAHKMIKEDGMSAEDLSIDRVMFVGFAADSLADLCPAGARIISDLTAALLRHMHPDDDEFEVAPPVVVPFTPGAKH
jgi:hypothetical protein